MTKMVMCPVYRCRHVLEMTVLDELRLCPEHGPMRKEGEAWVQAVKSPQNEAAPSYAKTEAAPALFPEEKPPEKPSDLAADVWGKKRPPREPYGGKVPSVRGSDTSRAAASRKSDAGTWRERVYDFLDSRGERGATDDEIVQRLGRPHRSLSPRRRELVLAGKVKDSGKRRETMLGREATVWVTSENFTPTKV